MTYKSILVEFALETSPKPAEIKANATLAYTLSSVHRHLNPLAFPTTSLGGSITPSHCLRYWRPRKGAVPCVHLREHFVWFSPLGGLVHFRFWLGNTLLKQFWDGSHPPSPESGAKKILKLAHVILQLVQVLSRLAVSEVQTIRKPLKHTVLTGRNPSRDHVHIVYCNTFSTRKQLLTHVIAFPSFHILSSCFSTCF